MRAPMDFNKVTPEVIAQLTAALGADSVVTDPETLKRLNGEGRVAFRYTDPNGRLDDSWNFNGSTEAIKRAAELNLI